jgi:hypothetical protein
MEKQNVTLSVSRSILKKAKIIAIERNTSLSGLMTRLLSELVEQDEEYVRAERRCRRRLKQTTDLGTLGSITWTREELHDR